ncbi:MAG: hypothetical protein ACOC9P_02945 [bacterium]
MSDDETTRQAVYECLERFLRSQGRDVRPLTDETDLIRDTGCTSEDGLDFVIDLSDAVGYELPGDFNPFVHDSGQRPMRLGELVTTVEAYCAEAKES